MKGSLLPEVLLRRQMRTGGTRRRVLSDGSRIQIYTREETEAFRQAGQDPERDGGEMDLPGNGAASDAANLAEAQGTVNINTATQEELQTVPGIGGKGKSNSRLPGRIRGVFICGGYPAGARHQRQDLTKNKNYISY